ncbi:MAG: HD domain-containing protein [Gammaproteobacteria bacterium]|nr:HD domain-containing protein [Gammaproteobacteria bacterium]
MTSSKEHDSQEVAAYTKHLSHVNDVKTVIATEDICNEQGAILVKAGTAIDKETTKRIINFKLTKPIESSVAIEDDLNSARLYQDISKLITDNKAITQMHKKFELAGPLKSLCQYYQTYPILRQKMTVLSLQMKRTYTQSILSAWFAILIAKQLGLEKHEIESIFIAALTHDIGMLHIEEEVLNKNETLTPEEWRQIKAHPIIGRNILDAIPSLPKEVGIAIAEHHERSDGTGYPAGKFLPNISIAGNIVALADSAVAVLERLRKNKRNLRDLIPILQMNQRAHCYQVYEALLLTLKRSRLSSQGIVRNKEMPKYIGRQLANISLLASWINMIDDSIISIGFTHKNRKIHAIQNVYINIIVTITGSGILGENYSDFLKQAKEKGSISDFREIEDVSLMLDEVRFHLERLLTMMRDYVDAEANKTGEISQSFANAIEEISTLKSKSREET